MSGGKAVQPHGDLSETDITLSDTLDLLSYLSHFDPPYQPRATCACAHW